MALVSIVIPVFNAEATIARAIRSCEDQTLESIEIICINDGSTDSTGMILKELHAPRLCAYEIAKRGVADAFNFGMQLAHGHYIARMDADDIMHPERLKKQVEFLSTNPQTGVVSCFVNYGGDRQTQEGYARHVDWINTLVTPEEIALNRFIDSPVCNPTVMFEKELFHRHGGAFNGDFPEDYEMWLRWMDAGVQFGKVPEVLFTWNDLPTRLTRSDERYSSEAFERAKTKYLVRFIQQQNPADRPVYLCGTGRITRRKSDFLVSSGIRIGGYVDIDPAKIGTALNGIPVISPEEIPPAESAYIVNYVSVRGAREELRRLFTSQNRTEGVDFISAG